jgi:hypothetical protein
MVFTLLGLDLGCSSREYIFGFRILFGDADYARCLNSRRGLEPELPARKAERTPPASVQVASFEVAQRIQKKARRHRAFSV